MAFVLHLPIKISYLKEPETSKISNLLLPLGVEETEEAGCRES